MKNPASFVNFFRRWNTQYSGASAFDGTRMTSEQDEIDQREDGGAGGHGDQRIIGADIRARRFP